MAIKPAHVDDVGTVFYIDVNDQGISLDADLDSYSVRIVNIKRPNDTTLIQVTTVSTETDPDDSIKKLKLESGTDVGTSLTGTGGFKLPSTELGDWIAEVFIGDGVNGWTSAPFVLCNLRANLS
jgi:hypothetical protein